MRIVQIKLRRDISADFHRRSAKAILKPSAKSDLLRDRQLRLPAFPTVIGHCIPTLGQILFVPATHRVVIKVKHLRNLNTGFPVIQQQKRIRPPCNAMILTLTLHTRQKFTAGPHGKENWYVSYGNKNPFTRELQQLLRVLKGSQYSILILKQHDVI